MATTHLTAPGARWDAFLDRCGVRGPVARDALLAATCTVVAVLLSVASVGLLPDELAVSPARRLALLLLIAAQSAALVLRRVRLAACVALVVATQVALVAVAPDLSVRSFAPFVAAATVGTLLPAARALRLAAGAGVAEAALATVAVLVRGGTALDVATHVSTSLAVWLASALVGVYVATRRAHLVLLRERAEQAERDRDTRVHAAVAAERARLARELHDVAAHHLSGMVVQAAAVERLVDRDPDAAREGARWLRDQGRATLDNLRQVVGLLRGDDAPDGTAPLPGLAALPDLVAQARDLGDDVELVVAGDAAPLAPLGDVSLYRIAQQAVTNARQHAPGARVRVRVEHAPGAVVVDVTNGPASRGVRGTRGEHGGAGLAVMRERAALVGGTLDAGPTPDGGWRVHARVPVEADAHGDDARETDARGAASAGDGAREHDTHAQDAPAPRAHEDLPGSRPAAPHDGTEVTA
ncbi:MAG: two-component sensor histidine kinase [Cellulomonas iranensis]|uniref:sensor histidine kinase n=1 Tax=Cellulomonas iranensis TaxID=76862 RepID=UPI001B263F0F|nr:histidine kinase [Cellulomonas iranensis]MBO9568180.1 two-component sensor histidine kinase [Cellulomonas iranensis]